MTTTYREAAVALWGEAGDYIHQAYQDHLPLFPLLPDSLPMVIGLGAYGRCIGLSRVGLPEFDQGRISIMSNLFKAGTNVVADTVLHEMMHVHLWTQGLHTDHDSVDWYAECNRLAPDVLGRELNLKRGQDRKSVRVPNPEYVEGGDAPKTLVRKVAVDVEHGHADVARFPHPFRPDDYPAGRIITVPSY